MASASNNVTVAIGISRQRIIQLPGIPTPTIPAKIKQGMALGTIEPQIEHNTPDCEAPRVEELLDDAVDGVEVVGLGRRAATARRATS